MKRKSSIGAGNTPATWQPEAKQSFDPFKYLDYVPGTVSAYRMAKRKKVTLGGMALVAYSGLHAAAVAQHSAETKKPGYQYEPIPADCSDDYMKCYKESKSFRKTVNQRIVAPVACGGVALIDGFRKKDSFNKIAGALLLGSGLWQMYVASREE